MPVRVGLSLVERLFLQQIYFVKSPKQMTAVVETLISDYLFSALKVEVDDAASIG